MSAPRRTIAVALHDIEPATFERCALIRDWLDDHGVDHVTLLVIPARDLHPLAERSPEMVSWLIERERGGDAIAQHGFQHLRSGARGVGPYQSLRTRGADHESEFLGLDPNETRRAVDAGWRLMKLAGIEPRGFVAPGYAYTPALKRTLGERFHWWAALLGLHRAHPRSAGFHDVNPNSPGSHNADPNSVGSHNADPGSAGFHHDYRGSVRVTAEAERDLLGPPISLSNAGRLRRALSPTLLRAGALISGTTLRLDLHPSDLEHPNHMLALEWVLKRSACTREAVTYEQLASAAMS